eukprot:33059_1
MSSLSELKKHVKFILYQASPRRTTSKLCGHIQQKMLPIEYVRMLWNKFYFIGMLAKLSTQIAKDQCMNESSSMCKTCSILTAALYLQKCSRDVNYCEVTGMYFNRSCYKYANLCNYYWNNTDLWTVQSAFSNTILKKLGFNRGPSTTLLQNIVGCWHFIKPQRLTYMILRQGLLDFVTEIIIQELMLRLNKGKTINRNESKYSLVMSMTLFWLFVSNIFTQKQQIDEQIFLIAFNKKVKKFKFKVNEIFERYPKESEESELLDFFTQSMNSNMSYYSIIDKVSEKYRKKMWRKCYEKQECMRMRCTNIRGRKGSKNKIKFVKCMQCHVATYCSKKCAIYDWTRGYHKLYCSIYMKQMSK